jgi:replicative DNA helicase
MKRTKIEYTIIAYLIKNINHYEEVLAAGIVKTDFQYRLYQRMYDLIAEEIVKKGLSVEFSLFENELIKGIEDEKKRNNLSKQIKKIFLYSKKIEEENLNYYLKEFKEVLLKESLKNKIVEIKSKIDNNKVDNVEEIISEVVDYFLDLQSKANVKQKAVNIYEGVNKLIKDLKENNNDREIIPTGFAKLDDILDGGLVTSSINYCIGRPGNGKSTLTMNIALNVALRGTGVMLGSLEMSIEQVVARALSALSCKLSNVNSIPLSKLKNAKKLTTEDYNSLYKVAEKIKDIPLFIYDMTYMTISQYFGVVNRYAKLHNVKLFIPDYYQLFKMPNGSVPEKESEYAKISEDIRVLSHLTNTCQLPVAQVSRKPEARDIEDRAPRVSDMRNSGKADQDAEVVIGAFREEYYLKEQSTKPNILQAEVCKNRDGEVGFVDLYFSKKFLHLSNFGDEMELSSIKDYTKINEKKSPTISLEELSREFDNENANVEVKSLNSIKKVLEERKTEEQAV